MQSLESREEGACGQEEAQPRQRESANEKADRKGDKHSEKELKQGHAAAQADLHDKNKVVEEAESSIARVKLELKHQQEENALKTTHHEQETRFHHDNKSGRKATHDRNKAELKKEAKEHKDRDKAQYERQKAAKEAHKHDGTPVVVGRDVAIDQAAMEQVQAWLAEFVKSYEP